MANRSKRLYINLFTALLLYLGAAVAHASTLTDLDGNPASIEDYAGKGKWLVVMFWASGCHICNEEAHQYVAMQARHKEDGNIQVLGITTDGLANKEAALAYINEHQLNFPNLTGTLEGISGIYYDLIGDYFLGTPTFLIFTPEGKIRAAQGGAVPAENIEKFIKKNTVASYLGSE